MKLFPKEDDKRVMTTSLPLPIHTALPITRQHQPCGHQQNRPGHEKPANSFLHHHADRVRTSYIKLISSPEYAAMLRQPGMDPEIAALATLFNRLPGVTTAESCGGCLTHGLTSKRLKPWVTLFANDSTNLSGLQILAAFLRQNSIKDTHYEWVLALNGCNWHQKLPLYEFKAPAMEHDLAREMASRQVIGERIALDLNTLTLALAFFEQHCGPNYFLTVWDQFLHGSLV